MALRPQSFTLVGQPSTAYRGEPICRLCTSGYHGEKPPTPYIYHDLYCDLCERWLDALTPPQQKGSPNQ